MQSLRKLPLQRAISSSLFISNRHHARYLSLARPCWNENTASKEQQSTTTTTSIEKFRKQALLICMHQLDLISAI